MEQYRHVLIVDDNGGIRALLTAALEDNGDRVSAAASGESMRELVSRDDVDVVILDVQLPGENGRSLALHAKALLLPVVLMSGSGAEAEFAARHGFQLVRKPFRMPELLAALDAAVAGGRRDRTDASCAT